MRMMQHEDTTLWFWQVFTGFALFFLASVHLYIMLTRPDRIGPYESADRVWSEHLWPLYILLLLAVELHGGIGLYRLAVKWGWFAGGDANATRRRLKLAQVGDHRVLSRAGLRHARGVHQDRHRAPGPLRRALRAVAFAGVPRRAGRATPPQRRQVNVIYTDVLVIGGGLAGLRMGIGAKRRGHDVVILSLVPPKRSHSAAAQGGMQASLGNVIKGQGDNEDVHFEDTVRGSDWGADQNVVRMFVNTAPKAVRELAAWGVPWSRVQKGDREVIINGREGHDHRARRSARPGRAARFRRHQEMADLLRFRRHRPRHALRGERPGDRACDSRARAHGSAGADP